MISLSVVKTKILRYLSAQLYSKHQYYSQNIPIKFGQNRKK